MMLAYSGGGRRRRHGRDLAGVQPGRPDAGRRLQGR